MHSQFYLLIGRGLAGIKTQEEHYLFFHQEE
jgi:hypothetical protein